MCIKITLDPGYGGIKVFGPQGAQVLTSLVANNGRQVTHSTGLKNRRPPLEVVTGDRAFYVGPNAHDWGRPVESLDFDRFVGSPEMRALVYGALTRYGLGDEERIALTAGLPLSILSGDKKAVQATVKAVRGFLSGKHSWQANGKAHTLTVADVQATSQAVGALFDYLLDDEGNMPPARKAEFKKEIGVLSLGMNTVELLVARSGAPVQRFTAGDTRGVRRLLELVNTDGLYSLGELDTLLRARSLDISSALPVWQREVLGLVEDRWGHQFRRFARVVVVGGGVLFLKDTLLARFGGKMFVPNDPVISTSRGLYRFALMQTARKRRRGG